MAAQTLSQHRGPGRQSWWGLIEGRTRWTIDSTLLVRVPNQWEGFFRSGPDSQDVGYDLSQDVGPYLRTVSYVCCVSDRQIWRCVLCLTSIKSQSTVNGRSPTTACQQ